MKSFLLCLSLAGVLALALVAGGATLDLGDFLALGFAAALVSWFFTSYSRKSFLAGRSGKNSGSRPQSKTA